MRAGWRVGQLGHHQVNDVLGQTLPAAAAICGPNLRTPHVKVESFSSAKNSVGKGVGKNNILLNFC